MATLYEMAQAEMPAGWTLWGNHGDGKWRAGTVAQMNLIEPTENVFHAVKRSHEVAERMGKLSDNPSTRTYEAAAFVATSQGHAPGSGSWWQALRTARGDDVDQPVDSEGVPA